MSNAIEITELNLDKLSFHKMMEDYCFTKSKRLAELLDLPYRPDIEGAYMPPEREDSYFQHNDKSSYHIVQWNPRTMESRTVRNYRRDCLARWLRERYSDSYLELKSLPDEEIKCDVLIISFPLSISSVKKLVKAKRTVYDRTDNWRHCSNKEAAVNDILAADIADKITCSSSYLMLNDKCILAENRGTRYDVSYKGDIDRYAYIGRHSDKVDYEWMSSLGKEVDLYGDFAGMPSYPHLHLKGTLEEPELVERLTHYKAGLIAFVDNEWTKGMLPIKLYNYVNAGLEVIVHNCPMAEEALKKGLMQEDWNDTFSKIVGNDISLVSKREGFSIWWSLSLACNFNCGYCCQRKSKKQYNADVDKVSRKLSELIRNDIKWNKYQISLLGGEPALFDLHTILRNLSEAGKPISVSVLTNFSLHSKEWWHKLYSYPNLTVNITASCHISQIKDFDEWADKAVGLERFKAKFVVNDDNWLDSKNVIDSYIIPKGLAYSLEGMRDSSNNLMNVSDNLKRIILEHGNDQTDRIQKVHKLCDGIVECDLRLSIKGNVVTAACKYISLFEDYPVDELSELGYKKVMCPYIKQCNLCMTNGISSYSNIV